MISRCAGHFCVKQAGPGAARRGRSWPEGGEVSRKTLRTVDRRWPEAPVLPRCPAPLPSASRVPALCAAALDRAFCRLTELPRRRDFPVISPRFPLLAFTPLLIACNSCLLRELALETPFQHLTASRVLTGRPSLAPIAHHFPGQAGPCVLGGVQLGRSQPRFPEPAPAEQGGRSRHLLELQRTRVKIQQTQYPKKLGC